MSHFQRRRKMVNKFIKSSFLTLFAFVMVFGLALTTRAASEATAAGIIISPPLTEKEVAPGTTFTGTIKVTNPNPSTDLKIDVTISDFKASGEDGEQTFVDPISNNTYSLGTWISVDKTFVLTANEVKEVQYSITVPANAEPGGHYGVIFFSPSQTQSSSLNGSGVTAIPKVGSLLLLTVPGDVKYAGNIDQFSVSKKLYSDSKSVVDFTTRFQNLGTNHVKPQGNIVITNLMGKEIATLQVNEKMGNVLPDSIRRFKNSWEKKYGFGYYKATVNLAFGESGTASSVLSFWIVPWKETTAVVVVLILIIWILSHLRWGGKGKNEYQDSAPTTNNTPNQTPPTPPVQSVQTEQPQTPPISTTPPTSTAEVPGQSAGNDQDINLQK